ncbi:hypothetical protein [Dactylosporangium sp. CS-033363]|uniref:hypothetical protein n=1 Tax=Dactylosporangium sp. CS-033363 TaxID=3239935 RepID=UPI003D93546B
MDELHRWTTWEAREMDATKDRHWLVVEHERFVARFLHPGSDDLEQIQDQDIYVTVTGGPTYYVSLMTLGAIDAVLRRWAATRENAGGGYFWSTDLVIIPRPGITAMIEAIAGLIHDDELGDACRTIPSEEEQDRI